MFGKVMVGKLKTVLLSISYDRQHVGLEAFGLKSSLFDVEDHWISSDLRQDSDVCSWRRTLISRQNDQTPVLSSVFLVACGGTETQLENENK